MEKEAEERSLKNSDEGISKRRRSLHILSECIGPAGLSRRLSCGDGVQPIPMAHQGPWDQATEVAVCQSAEACKA